MKRSLARFLALTSLLAGGGTVARAGWEEGVAALKAGKYADAARELEAVVAQQPEWAVGHRVLGQTLLKLDRNEEAVTHLRKAYDLNPGDVDSQLALGQGYIEMRRYGDAAQLLGTVNAASLPKDRQGFYYQMLAVAHDKTGQSEKALAALGSAVQLSPNNADLQYQYGTAAFNAGQTAAAIRALEKAASLAPNDSEKQMVLIQALIRQGRESTGAAKAEAYQKAVAAARSLTSRSATFDNLLLLGEAQLGATDYRGAVTSFQQASSKSPNDWLPLFYIGQAHTAEDQYAEAEAALKQALAKTSDNRQQVRVWLQLGFVHEKQRKLEEAKVAYQRAGDAAAVKRVEENQQIAEYNKGVEQEAERLRRLEEEKKRVEEELKELPGGRPPR